MKDFLFSYHPLVSMTYFVFVIGFSMFIMHPVCLAIWFFCAFIYSLYLNGKKAIKFGLLFLLPTLIATALLNPAFNHEGATILTYLRDGNPLTLESIAYGGAAALMLITVISWFSCFNCVMTTDKFVYLFGRIIPALSLILSMALRFVPRFKDQIKVISNAQRCVGFDITYGSLFKRAKHAVRILSIMVTWALENAIETAESMHSRGYGLPGRTAFSIYRLNRRDATALAFIILCGVYIAAGAVSGGLYFRYFPTIKGALKGAYTFSLFMACFALGAMPLFINIREDAKWKAIELKI